MFQRRQGSWRIGKRWRKKRKDDSKNVDDCATTTSEPSTARTSFVSETSLGGHTECLSYGDTASLSGSVNSDNNCNQLMSSNSSITTTITLEEQQQSQQQPKEQHQQQLQSVSSANGVEQKDRIEADAVPMPKITEEYDLLFIKEENYRSTESESDEFEDIYEEDDSECDDDIDSNNVGNDHQCDEKYQVSPANPLPQSRELSRELCKIVFGMGGKPYGKNRRRALAALLKVSNWVETMDQSFLRDFLTYGGLAKILDFLEDIVMELPELETSQSESSDSEDDRRHRQRQGGLELLQLRITVESIRNVARILSGLCRMVKKPKRYSVFQERINKARNGRPSSPSAYQENLTEATATVIVNHGGIEILLRASQMCCEFYNKNNRIQRNDEIPSSATFDGEAISLVEATEEVWTAIANTCTSSNDETATKIIDGVSVSVWDAGLVAMETFCQGIGFGINENDKDSAHSSAAVAAASAPPVIAVLLLNTSVFRAFETILVRRRGDPLVTRNLFVEQKVLSRSVRLIPGPKKKLAAMNMVLDINASSKSSVSLHSSLHSNINGSAHSDTLHSSINSCSIYNSGEAESTHEEEAFLLEEALSFFYECHTQELLFRKKPRRKFKRSNATDERWHPCEGMIPLCVAGLQKFGVENTTIRRKAIRILDAALDSCSASNNDNTKKEDNRQQIIIAELIEGAIEALAGCLVSDKINEIEKDKFRVIIRKIVGMESDGVERKDSGTG